MTALALAAALVLLAALSQLRLAQPGSLALTPNRRSRIVVIPRGEPPMGSSAVWSHNALGSRSTSRFADRVSGRVPVRGAQLDQR